jgi:hypothetical protein
LNSNLAAPVEHPSRLLTSPRRAACLDGKMRKNLCAICGKPHNGNGAKTCRLCWRSTLGTPTERFWAKVDRNHPGGHWLWMASTNLQGYGHFVPSYRRMVAAHRFSWMLVHGDIPKGMNVLHRCDTPRCVNPAHLFLGTQADNVHDMLDKGRGSHCGFPGEKNPRAKLTWELVRAIRCGKWRGDSHQAVAEKLGVAQTTISAIMRDRTWKE